MIEIRLANNQWKYDPQKPLGDPGGFGAVFKGQGIRGESVAVKRLHLHASEAAHRELQMADSLTKRSLRYVLPIYDAGRDANSDYYFIVMPIAERSLRQELDVVGKIEELTALNILMQITEGLEEVNDVIHRDLKPENILYHEQRWKIADFGIARFVENATSLRTLKDALSPPYAAPEQWLMQSPSKTTDIYALGCIAYELLTGCPPFQGDTVHKLMDHHLKDVPPLLKLQSNLFASLIQMMLRKQPDSRPSVGRVIQILHSCELSIASAVKESGLKLLEQAGSIVEQQQAQAEAKRATENAEYQKRVGLHTESKAVFTSIVQNLADKITRAAPNCRVIQPGPHSLAYELGDGRITLAYLDESKHAPYKLEIFQDSDLDIICGASIKVSQSGSYAYEWGANLWYMDWKNMGYRWIEAMYMDNPLMRRSHSQLQPYAVAKVELAMRAASKAIDVIQYAANLRPADDEDLDSFCDQWLSRFAEASVGKLSGPRSLPLRT